MADGNGSWFQQRVPLWVVIIGLGGTGGVGLSNFTWLEQNEPKFQQNTARIEAQAEWLMRIEKHQAVIDARLDALTQRKVDVDLSLERIHRAEEADEKLWQELARLRDRIESRQ